MKEQLYISIPEPCHEDWNQMKLAEQGRHCAVCQKNVIDFTDADDKAIIDFFQNYNSTACGRFTDEQLNRPVSNIEIKPASNFLKYAAGLLLPGLMIGNKVNAQKGKVAIVGDTTAVIPKLKSMPGNNFLNPSCENQDTRIVIGSEVSVSGSKKIVSQPGIYNRTCYRC